ncbi:hypothetical protein QUF70_14310 [Desulfobacterales bacterium HSG17]|nr:hypothetical protein [Desulfobacterales bacterium HSG17]
MKSLAKILMMLCLIMPLGNGAIAAEDGPVVLLIEAKGSVFYSADGQKWKDVSRNKFLFENWRVKTGADGTCMLLNRQTEMIEPVSSNTELEIHASGTKVVKGTMSNPESAKDIAGFFKRKFANVQKYTGVRRYDRKSKKIKLLTAEDIALSDDFPDLVWENAGEKYEYQLIVGKKVFEVPGIKEDIVRFKVPQMESGSFQYCVQVLFDDEIIYAPQKKGKLQWFNNDEKQTLKRELERIEKIAPGNGFLLGSLMEERGLKVAAMDQYRRFLTKHPDDLETRPFLIKILNELKLGKLEKTEMEKHHKQ